jgi:hypothetical protein
MWEALSRYQPYADQDGHGESWRKMCSERTKDAAGTAWASAAKAAREAEAAAWAAWTARAARAARAEAVAEAAAWAAEAAATVSSAADVAYWSALAIKHINQAIKERELAPSNDAPTSNDDGQAQTVDAQQVKPYRPHENMIQLVDTMINATAKLNTIVFEESSLLKARKAQRQPLTDEEIDALELPESGTGTVRDLVRVVEKAHGIGGDK